MRAEERRIRDEGERGAGALAFVPSVGEMVRIILHPDILVSVRGRVNTRCGCIFGREVDRGGGVREVLLRCRKSILMSVVECRMPALPLHNCGARTRRS